ncbi:MAG: YbjQ family protein [Candidatus Diapherotrites archaeon]
MIITTTDFVPDKKVRQILGIARGNAIRSRGVGGHFVAGLEQMVGGEISSYLSVMNDAREEALKRMTADAEKLGADAIINVRIVTSEIMMNAAEVVAYGTAVKLG